MPWVFWSGSHPLDPNVRLLINSHENDQTICCLSLSIIWKHLLKLHCLYICVNWFIRFRLWILADWHPNPCYSSYLSTSNNFIIFWSPVLSIYLFSVRVLVFRKFCYLFKESKYYVFCNFVSLFGCFNM